LFQFHFNVRTVLLIRRFVYLSTVAWPSETSFNF